MATEIFPLEVWTSQITQASVPANENALRVQVLEQSAIGVESEQPSSPEEDDLYVIGASPSGAQWSGFDQWDVAIFKGGTWLAFAPFEGWLKTVSGAPFVFTSGAWGPLTVPAEVTPPQILEVSSSTDLSKLTHAGRFLEVSSETDVTLTVSDDATEAWDEGTEIHIRMTGNGVVSFEGAPGVSLQFPGSVTPQISEQYGVATIKRVGPDTWALFGLLQEASA